MRYLPLLLSTLGSMALVVAVPLVGCSSPEPSASAEATESEVNPKPPAASADPNPGPAPERPATPPPAEKGDGGGTDAGAASDGGATHDSGVASLCQAASVRETEPNNDVATATKVPGKTGSFCGQVGPGEVDFFEFKDPDGTFGYRYRPFASNLQGLGITNQDTATGVAFRVTNTSKKVIEYRIELTFQ